MTILKTVLAVVVGLAIGSLVNMGLILIGSSVIPAPPGVDVSDAESIAGSMHLFELRHFVFPFLAHALGTLAGALVGGYLSSQHRTSIAFIISALFFAGGIAVSYSIPAPTAFIVTDLVFAYFPMAIAALWILRRLARKQAEHGGPPS